jgi:hypothetical protein
MLFIIYQSGPDTMLLTPKGPTAAQMGMVVLKRIPLPGSYRLSSGTLAGSMSLSRFIRRSGLQTTSPEARRRAFLGPGVDYL